MKSGSERRKKERYDAQLFLELTNPVHQTSLGRGVVIDVSLTGMAVDSEADLDSDQEVDCHIEVPVKVRAKVVHRLIKGQIKRYGLRFVGQGFLDKIVLKRMLKGPRKTTKINL